MLSARAISALSLSIIARGVFAGVDTPNHAVTSYPGTPASFGDRWEIRRGRRAFGARHGREHASGHRAHTESPWACSRTLSMFVRRAVDRGRPAAFIRDMNPFDARHELEKSAER